MTFEELQQGIIDICQPIVDDYEKALEDFKEYAEDRGLIEAIHWRTDTIARHQGRAMEARGWIDSITRATIETLSCERAIERIAEDYRFNLRAHYSTNPVSNFIQTENDLGRQDFIRNDTLNRTPLAKIEKLIRQYQEELCTDNSQ